LVDSNGAPLQSGVALHVENPTKSFHSIQNGQLRPAETNGWISLERRGVKADANALLGWIVSAPGYQPVHASEHGVSVGEASWQVALKRGASVELELLDLDGQAIAGATVLVSTASPSQQAIQNNTPHRLPGIGQDALFSSESDRDGIVILDQLRTATSYGMIIAGGDLAVHPASSAFVSGLAGERSKLEIQVAPILCCVINPHPAGPISLTAKSPGLGDSKAFASTLLRTRLNLKNQHPSAGILVGIGRSGQIAPDGLPCDVTCRSEDVAVWSGSTRLLPPSRMTTPLSIRFSPPAERSGKALIVVVDANGAPMKGLDAELISDSVTGPPGRRVVMTGQETRLPPGRYAIRSLDPAFETASGENLGAVTVVAGGLARADIQLAHAYRNIELVVRLPDGGHPSYATVGFKGDQISHGFRSMRPTSIPAWLPLGACDVHVRVFGFEPVSEKITVTAGPTDNPMRVVVTVKDAVK
jgi:hypothetical protein